MSKTHIHTFPLAMKAYPITLSNKKLFCELATLVDDEFPARLPAV
jgi:hypothetical protein